MGFGKYSYSVWAVQILPSAVEPVEGQLELCDQCFKGYFCK